MADNKFLQSRMDLGDKHGQGSYELPVEFSEGFSASVQLGYEESPVMAYARSVAVDGLEELGGKKLSPEELNQKFPDMEVPFDAPTSLTVATYKAERQKERRHLQYLANKGAGTIGSFVGNVIGSLADPVNFGLNYALGLGTQSLLARAGGARGFTQIRNAALARSATESVPTALAREGAEGFIGSVATEPLSYVAGKKESLDYTVGDAATNILVGTFAFPIGMAGVKSLVKLPRAVKNMINTDIGSVEKALNLARVQLENDKRINVDAIIKQHEGEVANVVSTKPDLDTSKPINGEFYAVATKGTDNLEDTINFSDLGDHYYVTDSKPVSNAYAAREFSDVEGSIIPVNASDLRVVDIDLPFDENTRKAFEGINTSGFETPRQALDAIDDPEVKAKVAESFKAQGYDGYKFDGGKEFENGKSHNAIALFENTKIKQGDQVLRGDKSQKIKSVSDRDVEALKEELTTEKGDIDYDPEIKKQVDLLESEPVQNYRRDYDQLKKENEELDQMLKEEIEFNKKAEVEDEGLVKFQEQIDSINKRAREEETSFKAVLNCLMGE